MKKLYPQLRDGNVKNKSIRKPSMKNRVVMRVKRHAVEYATAA